MISDPLGLIDAGGHVFNAAKHLTGRDGKPVQNKKTGRFMPRSTGRKPKTPVQNVVSISPPSPPSAPMEQAPQAAPNEAPLPPPAPSSPPPDAPPLPPPPAVNFDDINRAAAGAPSVEAVFEMNENQTVETCVGVVQMALMLIGQEEGMLTEPEKECLRRPLLRVLQKYNIGASVLPAELELAMSFASLIIIRLQRPKTATFFGKVKLWFGNWWFRRKGREVMNQAKTEFAHSPGGFVPPAPAAAA